MNVNGFGTATPDNRASVSYLLLDLCCCVYAEPWWRSGGLARGSGRGESAGRERGAGSAGRGAGRGKNPRPKESSVSQRLRSWHNESMTNRRDRILGVAGWGRARSGAALRECWP